MSDYKSLLRNHKEVSAVSDTWTAVIVSAVVSGIAGIIQVIVVVIDAKRTAKKIAQETIEKLRHRSDF